jgi:uncharacterized membrane protein YphA (DoxX/SURF4 family)
MELLILFGRIMFGLVFVAAALGHLTDTKTLARQAQKRGIPRAQLAVQLTGAAILLGAVSVMFGVYPDVGALILVAFLLATAGTIHRFWSDPVGDTRITTQTHFMKDLALAGGALALFGFFVQVGDGLGYTFTGPLF